MVATTRKLSWYGSLIFGALFIGAGYFIVHLAVDAYRMGEASEAWPTVQGSVIHAKVVSSLRNGKTHYSADIQYAYRIDGKQYKSGRIDTSPGTGSSSSDSSGAYEVVHDYPVGRVVSVYYDPSKPWVSVLEPGMPTTTWLVFGIGCVFMLMGGWIALSGIARVLLGVGMLGVLTFAWLKEDKKGDKA